jgi:SAM-dependent methyltransferase
MVGQFFQSMHKYLRGLRPKYKVYRGLSLPETFQRIYRTKAWGDDGEPFFSGPGSHRPICELYCASIVKFIEENKIRSVIDLGCGDFSVGRRIHEATGVRYTGIDVVPELIEHHRKTVNYPLVSFECADITCDRLPVADLCLIRQVLQHLSNEEVTKVLANLGNFPLVLISEHTPVNPASINCDKPHGPDVRAKYNSGLYIERPPFSAPAVELWAFPLKKNSILRTVLLKQPGSSFADAVA